MFEANRQEAVLSDHLQRCRLDLGKEKRYRNMKDKENTYESPGKRRRTEGRNQVQQPVRRTAQKYDNERYRRFLAYCEDRRAIWKSRQEEDEKRMKEQRRTEEHWEMLRECRRILKEKRRGVAGEENPGEKVRYYWPK